jgi:hypothetical protein
MRQLSLLRVGVMVLVCLLVACGSSSNEVSAYYVRAVHVMKDGPRMQLNINDFPLQTGYDYLSATTYQVPLSKGLPSESVPVDVVSFTPLGDLISLATIPSYEFVGNREYSVVAAGTVANPLLFITSNPRRTKPVGGTYLEFVHAAIDQPALDIYVTEPDVDLAGQPVFSSLSLTEASGSLEIAQGSYQIRITGAGSTTVLFDSGSLDFTTNAEWQMILADSIRPGDPPLRLISTAGAGGAIIDDLAMRANLRALNIDLVEGPLDVYAGPDDTVVATSLDYPVLSPFAAVPGGDLLTKVTSAGNPADILLESISTTTIGDDFTYVIGTIDGILSSSLVPDNSRSVATATKVRFVLGIPLDGYVNVYLTTEIPTTVPPPSINAVAFNQRYGTVSPTLNKDPGEYYLTFIFRPATSAGSETQVLDPELVQFNGGDVLTYIVTQTSVSDPTPVLVTVNDRP